VLLVGQSKAEHSAPLIMEPGLMLGI
jgi:hypothetical protein